MSAPVIFTWDGEAMRPLPRLARLCDRQYVVGEQYRLAEHHDRSMATHNHYWAALTDAWRNLPEDQSERFPSVEHLRKWALVRAGYANSLTVVCDSAAEARRFIATAKALDEFCVVTVREKVATVFTAKSQSMKSMGAKEFAESKSRVLDECARLIGVDPAALATNARQVAA